MGPVLNSIATPAAPVADLGPGRQRRGGQSHHPGRCQSGHGCLQQPGQPGHRPRQHVDRGRHVHDRRQHGRRWCPGGDRYAHTVGAGGSLTGSGTVTADVVNDGLVVTGDLSAALAIDGSYTQTAAGVLDIAIGGTTPVIQYDQLNISGPATLDGTLDISLINGFGP